MKRSTERILTTHVGSLARADSLIPLLRLREQGQPYDRDELARRVREAVAEVVRKQVEAGIDIVTDGEQGKPSFYGYIVERFSGFERKPAAPGKAVRPRAAGREYRAFPDYKRATADPIERLERSVAVERLERFERPFSYCPRNATASISTKQRGESSCTSIVNPEGIVDERE